MRFKSGGSSKWRAFYEDSNVFLCMAFLVPLLVRAVPEAVMGPFPTGFDAIGYYIPITLSWLRDGVGLWNFIATAPLLYVILMGATSLGLPIIFSLKILAPTLLGVLGLAAYEYARKSLAWPPRKSLLTALIATLYFVALRVSWDMLRTELGLIFLFAALIMLSRKEKTAFHYALLSTSMILVVFSHQLIATIMLFILALTVTSSLLKKEAIDARKLLLAMLPSVILFSATVYAETLTVKDFSVITGFPYQSPSGFMALYGFASYPAMVSNTLLFLFLSYLPFIPLLAFAIVKKYRGNLQLNAWILWPAIALLVVLVSPNALFPVAPYRWVLLLTYPLAFFAADGFAKIKPNLPKVGVVIILASISLGFMFLPNNSAFPYFDMFPAYAPSPMTQNTVPLRDCQDTENAINWLKNSMQSDAHLIVHDAFYGWAMLKLEGKQLLYYGYEDPAAFAQQKINSGLTGDLYLVWWINGWGGHGLINVPSSFREVYESGKIAVYLYEAVGEP